MKLNKLTRRIRDFSISASTLRVIGLLLVAFGLAGSVIRGILGVGNIANSKLWELMQTSDSAMALATTALIFQALEACAIPIFVFLLTEGAACTSSYRNYMLRVLLLAVLCEIPYNLAMTGKAIAFGSLNPVFSMLSCLIMLYFFRRFPGKEASSVIIKIFAVIGTFLWCNMLGVSDGACCVLLAAVLWIFREKVNFRFLFGVLTMIACCIFSPFYMIGALAFLPIYFYDDELTAKTNRLINYLSYPILLLITWLVSSLL